MKKPKKSYLFAIITVAIVLIVAVSVGVGYAIWKNTRAAEDVTELPGGDWNESYKYQVFALLDENGAVITAQAEKLNAKSVAFVGYVGLETELNIPRTVHINLGEIRYFNATKILTLPDSGGGAILFKNGSEYLYPEQSVGLRDNGFVKEIILPETIDFIASGAFSSMRELTKLTVYGNSAIKIGNHAFSNCQKLADLIMTRPLSGDSDFRLIFAGTELV